MVEVRADNNHFNGLPETLVDTTADLLSINEGMTEQKKKQWEDRIQEQFDKNKLVVHLDSPSEVEDIHRIEKEADIELKETLKQQRLERGEEEEDDHSYNINHKNKNKMKKNRFIDTSMGRVSAPEDDDDMKNVDLGHSHNQDLDSDMLLEEGRARSILHLNTSNTSTRKKFLWAAIVATSLFAFFLFLIVLIMATGRRRADD